MNKIYKNVFFGKSCRIGEFCVIGLPPEGKNDGELKTIIGDNAIIRSHSVIYSGNVIGNNFQTGNGASIREHNKIGNNVSIGTKSVVEHHIKIEDNVRVHSQAFICEFSVLKKGAWIGPKATFTNVLHPLCIKAKECLKGPIIEENAKIGANATLLPGIKIGKMSLVGAGAVVYNDVPAFKVVSGNPAKILKDIKGIKCRYKLIEKPY